MKQKKENKTNKYEIVKLKITDYDKLSYFDKSEKIRESIDNVKGLDVKLTSADILKIIDYMDDEKQTTSLVINKELLINKDKENIILTYRKERIFIKYICILGVIILIVFIGTYGYLFKERLLSVNKDINNDGVAEINIDTDGDGVADVNIDLNGDDKPDYNINYLYNGEALFNIKDGLDYYNKVNQDNDNDGVCDLNCDNDHDGFPEYNLDMDNDGVAELFIDSEGKGYATLNLDLNKDKECDVSCDTNSDNICDEKCLNFDIIKYIDITSNQNNKVGFEINTDISTVTIEGNSVECNSLFPSDQVDDDVLKECVVEFKVINNSSLDTTYNLVLDITNDSFKTDNLKYKIISEDGGKSINNYVNTPSSKKTILSNISLAANSKHTYKASFILDGTGDNQNIDKGRNFKAEFKLG